MFLSILSQGAYYHRSNMGSVEISPFDAAAFATPFYRVKRFDDPELAREIERLGNTGKVIIDAKTAASDVATSNLLLGLGFRKVCMQIRLAHSLQTAGDADAAGVEISPRLDLPDEFLWRHARNFCYDRFSLDPLLPREGVGRLYFEWIRNSLTLGSKEVIHSGPDFCTFSVRADGCLVIDLVSVLDHGKGIGTRLIAGAVKAAKERGATRIEVTTECENYPAWNLYLKSGFLPEAFISVFHLVK